MNQSESVYELVRQRLDQNEAVLAGMAALLSTFHDLTFDGIRGYAKEMLDRYPHIYTIELQPRIERKDLANFEAWAREKISPDYKVKDFGFGDMRRWVQAPVRPVYYPITLMEPLVESAKPILGLDVHADTKFKLAIDKTVETGQASVSAPFDLYEGGRGYLLFKVIRRQQKKKVPEPVDFMSSDRVISMLIHTNKFLSPLEWPSKKMSMLLYLKGAAPSDPNAQIDHINSANQTGLMAALLPEFIFHRDLPNSAQPFEFETREQLSWEVIRPLPMLLALLMPLIIAVMYASLVNQRRRGKADSRAAEKLLHEEKERALVTLRAISDAVITINPQGQVEYLNPVAEQALRKPLSASIGCQIEKIFPVQFDLLPSHVITPITECMSEKKIVNLADNSMLLDENGEKILIEGSVSPLLDIDGALRGAMIAFRDMGPVRRRAMTAIAESERRLQERQLEMAQVARLHTIGEMASGLSHELNQPLMAIQNYTRASIRILRKGQGDLTEVMHALEATSQQALRAGEIIRRLRAFVGKRTPEETLVDVRQTIQNSLALTEFELREFGVCVTTDFPDVPILVRVDSIQLEQVLVNLIKNAIDAVSLVSGQRVIEVHACSLDGMVKVAVSDSGPGISEENKAHVFAPFFTAKPQGMGLGLQICESIIESNDGKLLVSSSVLGGARFEFVLPEKRS
ncbi:CHASE domain-containing protein [Crenobacter sp. SG2303]|uniref:histidine kinase n=1 Tax=Crenobacter oryzisoli TaxID=3056844 RepID=A0ABT7XUN0_9NEIS|nr:ATP-binding protein [Crenobacter sp. SG2303]MDN0077507.1 CHASE domain-containing protein [Crenobacter sp. SG2303]